MSTEQTDSVGRLRAANLRQRMLRASRAVNAAIVGGLREKGFPALRSTHTALLSNLDMDGSNLTVVAQRAGMTKQAMGRLAEDLIRLGYVASIPDNKDRRAINLIFTESGLELMHQSFAVMDDIERRCIERIGKGPYQILLTGLEEVAEELEDPAT